MSRARLKVFLGAAPGVGKTYAMLEDGHRLKSEGRDVVIGFFEPHGRAETLALVGDLEVVPRRMSRELAGTVGEMDVDRVLARRPEVVLVDELAHRNSPGSKHAKRWQDVDDLLDAGIEVVTTLNIHHLDSLTDVTHDITNIALVDTIPDEVVRRADEIELVDLSQQGVRERLAAGKIYPPEQVDAALANYFRPGNLGALRELALSWTADRVDEAVAEYRELHGIDQRWETKERVVIALAGAAGGEVVVRRAARLAMRSGADLLGVFVRPTRELSEEAERVLPAHREILEQLGGRYQEVVGDDVGASLLAFARAENATQIVLGASRRSRLTEMIRGSPIARVIRNAADVDVHVISYESAAKPTRRMSPRPDNAIGRARIGLAWAIAAIGLPLVTWLLLSIGGSLELQNVLFVYLLLAVATGSIGGAFPAVATAVAGFLLANWYFAHPVRTLTIADPDQLFALFAFLVVSSTVGFLVGLASRRSAEARRARAQAEALAATTTVGHPVFISDLDVLLRRVREVLALDAVSVIRGTGEHWEVLAWDGSQALKGQSDGSESVSLTGDTTLVILGGRLTADDRTVLRAFAAQMVQAIERTRLEIEVESAESIAETDRLRTALLRAVSHDLRTPLATIKASLTSLLETQVAWTPEETQSFLQIALEETERLNRLVGRLLDASRVQVGAVHAFHRPVGLDEVVATALSGFRSDADRLEVEISEELPAVHTDPDLLERVLANLVENALTWSPPDQTVRIGAGEVAGRIDLRISDRGPGIPKDAREQIFQPFQRLGDSPNREGVGLGLAVARGLLEAMGNELIIEDTPGGGTTMVVALRIAEVDEAPAGAVSRTPSNA